MENSKGFKYIIFGVRALMENYVEVAHTKGKKVTVKDSLGVERDSIINDRRSLFDLGPINTFLSNNYVDGVRLRLAGRTMAASTLTSSGMVTALRSEEQQVVLRPCAHLFVQQEEEQSVRVPYAQAYLRVGT